MKLPGDLSSGKLIKILSKNGYEVTLQKGSHIRLTRMENNNSHHITIPNHDPIKIGTLNNIIKDLSDNLKMSKEDILRLYF